MVNTQRDEDRLRATMRRASKQKRVKERAPAKGLTKGYLEGEEEEDDASFSISKIKSQAKNAKKGELNTNSSSMKMMRMCILR